MNYGFSNKVMGLKPSAIREIFKYAADPTVISLSAGNPSPDAFPKEAIAEITRKVLADNPIQALQYSITEGYTPLREALKEYLLKKHSIGSENDSILITAGAQQAMGLACKVLVNEGDTVICESPSFIGSLNAFRSFGAKLCGIPLESDGINIGLLEQALKTEKNVRFIYTIPNFQNPSGVTMSLEKRKSLYELAKKYSVLIVEDNPYGDLRYSGEDIPSIKSFDDSGLVIYAGSFSKVISPGLRVGYAVAPAAVIEKMVVCKQGEDVHTSILPQIICERFITEYDFDAHLEMLRKLYSKKADLTKQLIDEYLAPKITYNEINGGLFAWCSLPEGTDMPKFCLDAVKSKVCVVPGNAFLPDESQQCGSFRINFSTPRDEQLEKGIKILGTLI